MQAITTKPAERDDAIVSYPNLFVKECRDRLHFGGNRRIIAREIGVVSPGVDNAEIVACGGNVKIKLFDNGGGGIFKINGYYSTCGASDLIHKSAGLAEEFVLGVL